ncbi:DMT family transporter [bacterium]|nr:DMT family transporter [bacterium]
MLITGFLLKKEFLGGLCIFGSAFCLYLTTAAIRWAKDVVNLESTFFVFSRFLLGFVVVCCVFLIKRKKLRPQRFRLILGRSLNNIGAVYCFFKAVSLTSAAEANILNMTYPLFIAVFFFLFQKQRKDHVAYLLTVIAFFGIWLIISPSGFVLRIDNLWGLASGIFGAIAITFLNYSRRYDDADTILFFMFGLGSLLIYLMFPDRIFVPTLLELKYLLFGAIFGVMGQYLLTIGFKYVTAVEGGIISSSRILIAAILGPFIVSDPQLTFAGWIGALLIFGTNVYLAFRKISF